MTTAPEAFLLEHALGGVTIPIKPAAGGGELEPLLVAFVPGQPAVRASYVLPDGRGLERTVHLGGAETWSIDGRPALQIRPDVEHQPCAN